MLTYVWQFLYVNWDLREYVDSTTYYCHLLRKGLCESQSLFPYFQAYMWWEINSGIFCAPASCNNSLLVAATVSYMKIRKVNGSLVRPSLDNPMGPPGGCDLLLGVWLSPGSHELFKYIRSYIYICLISEQDLIHVLSDNVRLAVASKSFIVCYLCYRLGIFCSVWRFLLSPYSTKWLYAIVQNCKFLWSTEIRGRMNVCIVACRPVARQRPHNKQVYNGLF
jgi:hypothetical protein